MEDITLIIGICAIVCLVYVLITSMDQMTISSSMSVAVLGVFAVMTFVSTASKLFNRIVKLLTIVAIAVILLDKFGYIDVMSVLEAY